MCELHVYGLISGNRVNFIVRCLPRSSLLLSHMDVKVLEAPCTTLPLSHLLKCCHYDGVFQFEAGCLVSRLRKWHCYSLTIVALLGMPGSSMTFMDADF